jgi:hypothetical protein
MSGMGFSEPSRTSPPLPPDFSPTAALAGWIRLKHRRQVILGLEIMGSTWDFLPVVKAPVTKGQERRFGRNCSLLRASVTMASDAGEEAPLRA